MLTVQAPAKINLTLEVLGKRADGFHEVRTVMQTVSLCDTLDFRGGEGIIIDCAMPGWRAVESLISRTISLLQETTGCRMGATVEITKCIPLASGLGGDSSNAATTLRGLNRLWKLGLADMELAGLAAKLGSDVTFFLEGGTALAEGRGEKITPLPPLSRWWVVLVVPKVIIPPSKTARLYATLKTSHFTDGQTTRRLVDAIRQSKDFEPSLVFNTFENVAFECFPGLKVYWEHILKLGARNLHLSGAGPALFSLAADKQVAENLYIRCRQQGMETYLAETCYAH